jgi:hypothetical protein
LPPTYTNTHSALLRASCYTHSLREGQQGQKSILIMSYQHFSNMSKEQKDRICSGDDVQQTITGNVPNKNRVVRGVDNFSSYKVSF